MDKFGNLGLSLGKEVTRRVFEGAIQSVCEHSSGGQSKAPEIHALHTVEQGSP